MRRIYLDHNASTALDPLVLDEMLPWLRGCGRNASSAHHQGQLARVAIDRAREQVAAAIGAHPDELVFTSGGTESNNLAILGSLAQKPHSYGVLCSAIEHKAVLEPCERARELGHPVELLGVDADGLLRRDTLPGPSSGSWALLSVMLANNDTGAIQAVRELCEWAHDARGKTACLVHSDAVQAVGKQELDVEALGVDLLSLSAHKLHGPQGVGALYVRRGVRLSPVSFGGSQERGLRPGTENIAGIVGLGKACELATQRLFADTQHVRGLRDAFEVAVLERIDGVHINAGKAPRLCNTSNLRFEGLQGDALAIQLDLLGVAVSTGAACSAWSAEPSHVLRAMSQSPAQARSSLRISFGRENTRDDLVLALAALEQSVQTLRAWASVL